MSTQAAPIAPRSSTTTPSPAPLSVAAQASPAGPRPDHDDHSTRFYLTQLEVATKACHELASPVRNERLPLAAQSSGGAHACPEAPAPDVHNFTKEN